MKYIDSNIFLYAALENSPKGEWAGFIIHEIESGNLLACTSFLTYDEFAYKVRRVMNLEKSLELSHQLLSIENLTFLDINSETIQFAHTLIHDYSLFPRDTLHASSAILHKASGIISEDSDFDKISDLERIWME